MKNIVYWFDCVNEDIWHGGMDIHNTRPNLEDYLDYIEACLEGWKGGVDIHF